jgi:surface carbohydrate biosynthesis protein
MSKRFLYVPVEIKAREFLGKTFLAARAAERGWAVFMGESNRVREYLRGHAGGVYIEIGIPEKKASRLAAIRAAGHCIANMCEEGLVYSDGRDYCNRKLGPNALRSTDRLLVVGSRNADDIREYRGEFADKIAITGNPRFDTLLSKVRCVYRRDGDALRERYGRFVLVNTNFTRVNAHGTANPANDEHVDHLLKKGLLKNVEHGEFFRRYIDYHTRLMQGLQDLLQNIAASNLVDRIVIRPHPVENRDTWHRWAEPLGIDVCCEGSAIEWMLAAEAVLHPGCTTAIEGLLLDRPVFSYVPEPDSDFLNPSDSISEWVSSADDFLERLSQIRNQSEGVVRARLEPQRQKLGRFIANVEAPYAADRILNALEQVDPPGLRRGGLRGLFSKLRRRVRQDSDWKPSSRKQQKFPGITKAEAEWAVGQWLGAGILSKQPAIETLDERLLVFH